MSKKNKIINISICIFGLILFLTAKFISNNFNNISFEQLLYSIFTSKGGNFTVLFDGAIYVLLRLFIIIFIFLLVYKLINKYILKNKEINKHLMTFFSILFLIVISYSSFNTVGIIEYIKNQNSISNIFEKYYVDAKDVNIEFPKEKRNLIYIYLESMEMTCVSKKNGGYTKESYIPNLEQIAINNINFSNNNKLGGAYQVNNTNWTMAALISHTAGIPLKLSIGNKFSTKFPNIYNLGDILKDNGYNNYFMIGSDATFGKRDEYFKTHGDYTIYDYKYAKEKEYIDEDYFVWWGYEDKKLFDFAKEELLEISKQKEPFNFTILTVDTHFTDGYIDNDCEEKFDSKYANAIYCSDKNVSKFIDWIQKQDFYKDTTIILVGDHLTMQGNFFETNNRTVYNAIINSKIKPIKEKERLFSSLDMFPTTLTALGAKIEGDKLGLGVNLFSNEKTLIEEIGIEKLNKEISKKSNYYNDLLLGNNYYEIKNIEKN